MPTPTRYTNQDVSVFTLESTAYIDDLENASIDLMLKEKEAKGIKELADFPWPVGTSATITAKVMCGSAAALALIWGASVTCTFNTGFLTYSGQFLVTQVKHQSNREDLQTQDVTLKSQGSITAS